MKLKTIVEQAFGQPAHYHALFYNYPGGLRFELAEGGAMLDLLLVALRKATRICETVFAANDPVLVYLRSHCCQNGYNLRPVIRALRLAGMDMRRERDTWVEAVPPDERFDADVEEWWVNAAFLLPKAKLQNVLWCAVARDFGALQPNPGCGVYLLDPQGGLLVHPYDDRGMDIVGQNRPALAAIYAELNALLLDYDRDAMDASFQRQPAQP